MGWCYRPPYTRCTVCREWSPVLDHNSHTHTHTHTHTQTQTVYTAINHGVSSSTCYHQTRALGNVFRPPGWETEESSFDSRTAQGVLITASILSMRPTHSPNLVCIVGPSLLVRRPDLETDGPSPSSATAINTYGYTSCLPRAFLPWCFNTGTNLLQSNSANKAYMWLTFIKFLSICIVTFSARLTKCVTRSDLHVTM